MATPPDDPPPADPSPTETAILIPIPESEPAGARYRSTLDQAAGRGVPAHVTVLYPFVPPEKITDAVISSASAAVASVGSFDCEFAGTKWFGRDVLWLAPEPDEPFRALTRAVRAAFPLYRPYGGTHDDVVPHLTIGHASVAGVGELRAAEAGLGPMLPIRARVTRAWLMAGRAAPGSWHQLAEFPLAP
jgi:2'-5' RNA ligase